MISDLARTAENLDSALTRAELSASGRAHNVHAARQHLARIVAATERRLAALALPEVRQ